MSRQGESALPALHLQHSGSVEYFVESNGVKSEVYKLEVADLPYVKQIDLMRNFPAYTRLASKSWRTTGDIAALAGTVATSGQLTGRVRRRASCCARGEDRDATRRGGRLRRRRHGEQGNELPHRHRERRRRELQRVERA